MRKLLLFSLFSIPGMSYAHPGHGASNGHDVLHYLLSPEHIGPAILLLTAAALYFMMRTPAKAHTAKPKN